MTCLAIALALLVQAAQTSARPTSAALRRTYQANRFSILEVLGPKRSGLGIIVGAGGEVLTSIDYVGTGDAKVRFQGRELPARIVLSDPRLKVALLEIAAPGSFPSAAVKVQEALAAGNWVLGIVRPQSARPSVVVGSVLRANDEKTPFAETNLAIPPGSPVFDPQGRLVGIAVVRRTKGSSSVLPLATIKEQLATVIAQ